MLCRRQRVDGDALQVHAEPARQARLIEQHGVLHEEEPRRLRWTRDGDRATSIGAIIAPLFARIFYRNALNLGIPCFEADLTGALHDGLQPPPTYKHPKKHWRLKRSAVPQWYRQRHGLRGKAQSGAARVARFRPPRSPAA